MSSGQKVALSFLCALAFFAGFVFFAQSDLMSQIETRFYAQSKISQKQEQLNKLAESCDNYISNILKIIQTNEDSYLNSPSVKSYAVQNPSEKDEIERRNLTSSLFDTLDGFEGIRLIENSGRSVHFSTFDTDILKTDGLRKTYKNYPNIQDEVNELSPDVIMSDVNNPERKIYLDAANNRIVISFPFFITDKTSFGTLVCYFSLYDFEQNLINNQLLPLGEHFEIVNKDTVSGFVTGIPADGKNEFVQAISDSWKKSASKKSDANSFEQIVQQTNGTSWILLCGKDCEYIKLGGVYKNSLFELPAELVYLIYVCVFITLLLIFFLVFSLKRDYLIKIKQRIKKVQLGIINEYLENKQQIEWAQIARQLEYRKEELSLEIKKSVGGKNSKYAKIVDAYLEQSWTEIINVINSQHKTEVSGLSGASIEEIRKVMEEVLKSSKININMASPVTVSDVKSVSSVSSADDVEEIDEIEEAEELDEVEALDEVEDLDEVETLDNVEEIEEVEALDEVEEAEEPDEVEDLDEVETLDNVEEIEEVEALDEVEEAEEPDEVENSDDVQTVEELEDVEKTEEITQSGELDGAVEVENTESDEEVEEAECTKENDLSGKEVEIEEAETDEEIQEPEILEELDDTEEIEIPVEKKGIVSETVEVSDFMKGSSGVMDYESIDKGGSAIGNDKPEFHYVDSNLTFTSLKDDSFANCDTVYAEDLCIGSEYTCSHCKCDFEKNFKFKVYIPDFTPASSYDDLDEIEELEPSGTPFYSMTQFASNDIPVSEGLEEAGEGENAIVEEKGIYSISKAVKTAPEKVNAEFKQLVDSVLSR